MGIFKAPVFIEDQLDYGGTISHAHVESRSMFHGVLEEDGAKMTLCYLLCAYGLVR
jgi:hypothetical protein